MANLDKFKDQARKFEQKEQWPKAIEQLLKAIEVMEKSTEDNPDLSLYNRVGDLYQKSGDTPQAVAMYERAAEKYGEGGFHNNAIALCNKVLRLTPGRSQIYLKLGMMFAAKGFISEARQNLLEYADRMQKAGQLEEAFKALKAFAEITPGQDDIWGVLAQQARAAAKTDEQKEQVEKLLAEFEHKDRALQRRSRMSRSMMTGEELPPEPSSKRDLVFLDLGDVPSPRKSGTHRAPAIQPRPAPPEDAARPAAAAQEPPALEIQDNAFAPASEISGPAPSGEIEPLSLLEPTDAGLELEPTALAEPPAAADLGLEPTALSDVLPAAPPARPSVPAQAEPELLDLDLGAPAQAPPERTGAAEAVAGLPLMDMDEEPPAEAPAAGLPLMEMDEEPPEAAPTAGLPLIETEPEPAEVAAQSLDFIDLGDVTETVPTAAALEARLAVAPDDWATRRRLGEVLLDEGKRERGLAELDAALEGFEQAGALDDAYAVTEEILRLDTNSVRHQQKRVELAYRQGDKTRLVDAYNELGDALLRNNDPTRAIAVYRRVIEHDAGNARARAALDTLEPPAAREAAPAAAPARAKPAAPVTEFVDLGAMMLEDDEEPKDTRMRVEDEEPTGDEEADFKSMLQAFKKGIAANVGEEDFQSHYDLGVAYREMGLLDEAIAEFQKALRATDGRLRASEALGMCFFDKGQFAVAETILRRGLEAPAASDAERIGLLYWLGRSLEEQAKGAEALTAYNRVFGVDINFQDVSQRVQALHARAGA